jgi:hypothetical protein
VLNKSIAGSVSILNFTISKDCWPELAEGGLSSKFHIGFDKLSLVKVT